MNDFGGIFPEDLWGGRPTATIAGFLNEKLGLSMAIASRGQHELVDARLDAFGITKMFQAIIFAEDHVNGKLVPDLFLVAAPECIAFEGSFTGIEDAKMACLGFLCLRQKHKKKNF